MTIKYGLTLENAKLILEKAKTKNNGVYQFRGVVYRVFDNKVTHFVCPPDILERCGGFNVKIGNFRHELGWKDEAKKILRKIV